MGEKLCPFATHLWKQPDLLRIVSSHAINVEQAVQQVHQEVMELMDNHNDGSSSNNSDNSSSSNNNHDTKKRVQHETTLVVLDKDSFVKEYLDFVRLSWELQEHAIDTLYRDKLQLVLFHPYATHQTYGDSVGNNSSSNSKSSGGDGGDQHDYYYDNPADYTIRSPYPTIHLLREEDVLQAVQSGYPNLEYLPSRNKAKLTAQGMERCRQRLQDCYVTVPMTY